MSKMKLKYPKTVYSIVGGIIGLVFSFLVSRIWSPNIGFVIPLALLAASLAIGLPVAGVLVGWFYGYVKSKTNDK